MLIERGEEYSVLPDNSYFLSLTIFDTDFREGEVGIAGQRWLK